MMYCFYIMFDGKKIVLFLNNLNFVKGVDGEVIFILWDDVEIYFYEFGYVFYFLVFDVEYLFLYFGVCDYIEFQFQLLECWLIIDEVINNYLVYYEIGELILVELVEKIKKVLIFNEGFKIIEYMVFVIMDLKYYIIDFSKIDFDIFECEEFKKFGMLEEIVMCYCLFYFGYVFLGEGYVVVYYGYMWVEVFIVDVVEVFMEVLGGFYDKEVGDCLVKYLFVVCNVMDLVEVYCKFCGCDVKVDVLMCDCGFFIFKESKE